MMYIIMKKYIQPSMVPLLNKGLALKENKF